MDDSIFSSQFQEMRNAFAREGITIEVAYTPSGRADYMYEADRLLAQARAVSGLGWVTCRMCTGVTSGKPPPGAGLGTLSRSSSTSSACGTVR